MSKNKKSITLNTETAKLLEELAKKTGATENNIIAIALHKLAKDLIV